MLHVAKIQVGSEQAVVHSLSQCNKPGNSLHTIPTKNRLQQFNTVKFFSSSDP